MSASLRPAAMLSQEQVLKLTKVYSALRDTANEVWPNAGPLPPVATFEAKSGGLKNTTADLARNEMLNVSVFRSLSASAAAIPTH